MSKVHAIPSQVGLNFAKKPASSKPSAGADFWQQVEKSIGVRPQANGRDPSISNNLSRPALRPLSPLDMIAPIKGGIAPLQPLIPAKLPLKPLGDSPFDGSMSKEPKSEHEKLQHTARKLVAQTFYGPMLKTMRESPFKDKIFSGGRGGEAFTSMLDQKLAEHMARSSDSKLVRSITRKFESNAAQQGKVKTKVASPADNSINQNVRDHVAPGLRA